MKHLSHIGATLLLVTIVSPLLASEVSFTGYVKSFALAQDKPDVVGIPVHDLLQSQNSIRLMWDKVGERFSWQLHYEFGAILSSRAPKFSNGTVPDRTAWRMVDLDATINDDPKAQLLQNLDRFNFQVNMDTGVLTVGRQPITFGMARVINPTDVFLPFDVRTLNTEYRIGVDAIRFQHAYGQLGELDFGVILGEDADPEQSAAFFQMRTNHAGTDYQLAVSKFANETLLGGGLQTALSDFGFWFEVASVFGDEDFTRLSTGLDYAFTEHVFGMIEYHYNGAGVSRPQDYIANTAGLAYQSGAVFLLGKNYLIPVVTIQLSPLWGLSTQAILNLDDQSAFLSVAAEYSVSDNLYMDLGVYCFAGKGATAPPLAAGSEYGANPNTLYASLRYYF